MKTIILNLSLLIIFNISAFAQSQITLSTGDFTGFEIDQPLDVYVHQSDSCYIQLKGANIDAGKVKLNNNNGYLTIEVSGSNNINSQVHIFSKQYDRMLLSGTSELHTIGQLKGEKLHLQISGASDAKLNLDYSSLSTIQSGASDASIYGKVDSMQIKISGASDFDAFGTKNIYTHIVASGSSDASVNPDSTLIAKLSGASELSFKKEPAFKSINSNGASEYGQKSSSGELVELNNMSIYEEGDTVRIDLGNGRRKIVIVDGDEGVRIKTKRCNIRRFKGNWAGVELGINGYMTPEGSLNMPTGFEFLELKYEKSTNFNINFFQQSFNLVNNHFGLVTGMGIKWVNYRFSNNVILSGDSAEIYGYHDLDPTRNYSKSKLTASYLMIPVLFEYQTNPHHRSNSFHISVGVIGGLRLGSHTKQVYYNADGGGKQKQKGKDSFHLQPFVLEATTRIGWGPINLFATYSLIDMFRQDRGPELRPFTVGVILPFT
ncbi:MAG: DUF2807 domain-containing protein [Bacteroidales bacterium]|nr:DUF2807 domain-containing protein [Bacteroidales bacterium]